MEFIELLREIAENTKPDNSGLWIAVVSSASALLGALIGAVLLYRGVVRQIASAHDIEQRKLQANIVTTERLRWLQDIRGRTSNFYADLDMHYNLLKRPVNPQQNPQHQLEMDELAKKVMVEFNQITLLLNPAKSEQKEMREALNDALKFFQQCVAQRNQGIVTFNDQFYAATKTDVFNALTLIGSQTWKKIKQLQ